MRKHTFVASRQPYVNPSTGAGIICWCGKHKDHPIHAFIVQELAAQHKRVHPISAEWCPACIAAKFVEGLS